MAEDSPAPAKRLRLDETDSIVPNVQIIEDKCVWKEDGNIVVSAGADPILMFKLHRSTLSELSEVFAGLFDLPLSDAIERYQDVPMVHLPDSPEDVKALLRYVHHVSYVCRSMSLLAVFYLILILPVYYKGNSRRDSVPRDHSRNRGTHAIGKKIQYVRFAAPLDQGAGERVALCLRPLGAELRERVLEAGRRYRKEFCLVCGRFTLFSRSR